MGYKILYIAIYMALIITIIIYTIGFRGVYFDYFMLDDEKNKFLIDYAIIIVVSLISLIILIRLRKKI